MLQNTLQKVRHHVRNPLLASVVTCIAASSLFLSSSVLAQEGAAPQKMALNHVWSRLADKNGELGSIESVEFSPDSEYIVSGSKYDYTVRMFRVSDGFEMWKVNVGQEIERVAWTADSKRVVSVSEDFFMRVFDAKSGELLEEIKQEAGMDGLTLSNNGKLMATGAESQDEDNKISYAPATLYSTEDWSEVLKVDHGATINDVDFSSDDQFFITAGHPFIKVWNTKTGELIDTFETFGQGNFGREYDGFVSARINDDDSYLAAGTGSGNLYVFRVKDDGKLKHVKTINRTGRKIETVTWTADGRYILQAGHSPVVTFFSLDAILTEGIQSRFVPTALEVPLTDNLEYMEFNREGTLFATAQQDGTIQLFTFMSDNPMINQLRHKMVKEVQSEVK
uniref:WD40 repeat domain-containing protein n=1 Tax=Ningiella ruwaisensis TaxID=2364274 RepID=UPI0010A07EDC|nr:hypothetical protein [Ningiella ruwaisensis]